MGRSVAPLAEEALGGAAHRGAGLSWAGEDSPVAAHDDSDTGHSTGHCNVP